MRDTLIRIFVLHFHITFAYYRRNTGRTQWVHHGMSQTTTRKSEVPVPVTFTKGSVHIIAQRGFVNNVWQTIKLYIISIYRRNTGRTQWVHHGMSQTATRKSEVPVPVTFTKGSVHIIAQRGFVDYVLHDPRALKFRDWVKDTGKE